MKKKLSILLLLFVVVGCKKTNLSCTKMIIDTDEIKVNEKISIDFKKKKLDKTFYTLDYHYATNIEENAEATKKSLEEQFSTYKDSKGVTYFFNNIDQGIHFELQINPKKLAEEEKDVFEKQINYKSYSDARDKLAKDGYHCK